MRHRVKGRKISRKTAHRSQTLRDLSTALIRNHRIVTTLAKAKALRPYFEPIVTRAKEDTQHNRRQVFSKLNDKKAVSKLFNEIGPEAQGRPGGYTRIIRHGYRKGDGAEMAIIELVDYNDIKPEQDQKKRKKTRRAGRKKKTTSAEPKEQQQQQTEESAEETSEDAEATAAADEQTAEEADQAEETATEEEEEEQSAQEAETTDTADEDEEQTAESDSDEAEDTGDESSDEKEKNKDNN